MNVPEILEYGNLLLLITHLDSYVPTLLLYVTYDVCAYVICDAGMNATLMHLLM